MECTCHLTPPCQFCVECWCSGCEEPHEELLDAPDETLCNECQTTEDKRDDSD